MNPYEAISAAATPEEEAQAALRAHRRRTFLRLVVIFTVLVVIFAITGFFYTRHWIRQAMHDSLPQLDGAISISGLSAPVTVQRDGHGESLSKAAINRGTGCRRVAPAGGT